MVEKLLLATHNRGKIKEFERRFVGFTAPIICAADLNIPEPEETGETFAENALLKARHCCEASGLVALADDSGICVDLLDGAPGVYSARWAVDQKGNRDFNIAFKKIEELLPVKEGARARMVCALAAVWPDGQHIIVEGIKEGTLVFPPRGEKNFGYDPIFKPDGHDQTYAEMEPDFKITISHRGLAFEKMLPHLL